MRIFKSHPLLKLVNSYVIDAPQPSNISYLWNFGVRRVRGVVFGISLDSFTYSTEKSSIRDQVNRSLNIPLTAESSNSFLCILRGFTLYTPNKNIQWGAEFKRFIRLGLPLIAAKMSRSSHVEDNKPDTQWCDLFSKCILSRICRYIQSIAICHNQRNDRCREALHHSSRGRNNWAGG